MAMDDIVRQAMAKWPNVPHCFGWLALDARGAWRMRDERAQHLNLPGDRLTNAALVGFINRNYTRDERGCWYFQNGPQRVYLQLEATPFIARTDPVHGLLLHTCQPVASIDEAFMTPAGAFIVRSGEKVAQVDDRDMAQVTGWLQRSGKPVSDEDLLEWLRHPRAGRPPRWDPCHASNSGNSVWIPASAGMTGELTLHYAGSTVAVQPLAEGDIEARLSFVRVPRPA